MSSNSCWFTQLHVSMDSPFDLICGIHSDSMEYDSYNSHSPYKSQLLFSHFWHDIYLIWIFYFYFNGPSLHFVFLFCNSNLEKYNILIFAYFFILVYYYLGRLNLFDVIIAISKPIDYNCKPADDKFKHPPGNFLFISYYISS